MKNIFGKRDSIHIIDLTQTLELTNITLEKIFEVIKNNGKILFISTKKQASDYSRSHKRNRPILCELQMARGMLTNWGTISNSIKKLKKKFRFGSENRGFTKRTSKNEAQEINFKDH